LSPYKTHKLLEYPEIRHGFFGRLGGVSQSPYDSLNAGSGSDDKAEHVLENRSRIAQSMGTTVDQLISNHQIHSAKAITITRPLSGQRVKADGMVTREPGIALSALGADCGPILFFDPDVKVIGACHAGWGGALKGIIGSTVEAMIKLDARVESIKAVLGPCISQENYEVGPDFRDMFVAEDERYDRFFKLGPFKDSGNRRPHFDLKRFILFRLREAGLSDIDALPDCTYGDPQSYFSYRYNTHAGITDYGRNISTIILNE